MTIDYDFLDTNAETISKLYEMRNKTNNNKLIKLIDEKVKIEMDNYQKYLMKNVKNIVKILNYLNKRNENMGIDTTLTEDELKYVSQLNLKNENIES